MGRIGVFGLGYVGLTVSVCFAARGFQVLCGDVDREKVKQVSGGQVPFYEPMLRELLIKAVRSGRLKAEADLARVAAQSDFSFICVGTPSKPDGSIDLSQVEDVCRQVGSGLKERLKYHVVVVKSTVTPGTTQNLVKPLIEECSGLKAGKDFGLTVNPEFLREGSAINDMLSPDRVIIGEYDRRSGDMLENLYRNFYGEKCPPILRMNLPSAEMVKYASNAFLALKISFINEMANMCERVPGLDVVKVADGIGLDRRIGRHFLNAGIGFGGSCLPKDTRALIKFSESLHYEPKILKAVIAVNERQALRGVELARELIGNLKGKTVAVLGLSFKPNTSDIREAPPLKLVSRLLKEGAKVKVYDPAAMAEVRKTFGEKLVYAASALEAVRDAECCIIATEWDEFKSLKPEDFVKHMRNPAVVDCRRIYDPEVFSKKLRFKAIGLNIKVE